TRKIRRSISEDIEVGIVYVFNVRQTNGAVPFYRLACLVVKELRPSGLSPFGSSLWLRGRNNSRTPLNDS
ncbi:MAG: hypothetical protein AB7E49_10715, partial [Campylobacterales bacterium]